MNFQTLINNSELRLFKSELYESPRCSICMEDFKTDDIIRVLNCNHYYHHDCIDKWLIKHKTCPYCRNNLTENIIPKNTNNNYYGYLNTGFLISGVLGIYYLKKTTNFYPILGFTTGTLIGIPFGVIVGINSFFVAMLTINLPHN